MNTTEHDVSPRSLFVTWLALMLLAALSFGLRFVNLGAYNFPIAMGIAAVKAVLVALVFMELAFEPATLRFAFATGFALLALLLVFMISDVLTRTVAPLDPPPGMEQRYHG
jgi:cytochrome c oxidase subunit 4